MGPRQTQFRQIAPHVSSSTHPQNMGKFNTLSSSLNLCLENVLKISLLLFMVTGFFSCLLIQFLTQLLFSNKRKPPLMLKMYKKYKK